MALLLDDPVAESDEESALPTSSSALIESPIYLATPSTARILISEISDAVPKDTTALREMSPSDIEEVRQKAVLLQSTLQGLLSVLRDAAHGAVFNNALQHEFSKPADVVDKGLFRLKYPEAPGRTSHLNLIQQINAGLTALKECAVLQLFDFLQLEREKITTDVIKSALVQRGESLGVTVQFLDGFDIVAKVLPFFSPSPATLIVAGSEAIMNAWKNGATALVISASTSMSDIGARIETAISNQNLDPALLAKFLEHSGPLLYIRYQDNATNGIRAAGGYQTGMFTGGRGIKILNELPQHVFYIVPNQSTHGASAISLIAIGHPLEG